MIINSQFKPAWWLPGAHTQTLWASMTNRFINLEIRRERLELADGDFIDLDWTTHRTGPIVLILHGLQGSSDSNYARGLMQACHAKGWRAIVMHFRGCSGEPNRLARAYHSGETNDLHTVIDILHRREPETPICAAGYSLGGNVLLKWLGEYPVKIPLSAAAAVSVPYELKNGAQQLDTGFSKIYQRHLLKSLLKATLKKQELLEGKIDFVRFQAIKTIYDFDDAVTAPLHGFKDAEEYYSRSSSRQYLKHICLPTLLLHAENDPFMTTKAIPGKEELSDCTTLELSASGGHVGFVSGSWPWSTNYWLENRLIEYFSGHFSAD